MNIKKVAIIGGGISGVSLLRELSNKGVEAHLFEGKSTLGGLVRCKEVSGHLYHLLGGHVFNSKNQQVLEWVKQQIPSYESSMIKAPRNADILFDFGKVAYPIENFLYQLPEDIGKAALAEIISSKKSDDLGASFGEFLRKRFGQTLYDTYFSPYNKKIWGEDLDNIPLGWLEGKLPMPSAHEIVEANVFRKKEADMVHSSFFYPKNNGSQFWLDQLAPQTGIFYNQKIDKINKLENGRWTLNCRGDEYTDLVYTGDVSKLHEVLASVRSEIFIDPRLQSLKARGISNALCRIPKFNTTWTYLPESKLSGNRIINTGLFSPNNTPEGEHSGVFEFPYGTIRSKMEQDINTVFPCAEILATNDVEKAYVIQGDDTRSLIKSQKAELEQHRFYLLGRFAEWEYYNMDMCIGAALNLSNQILKC